MGNGYIGKMLWVDLSQGGFKEEPLDEKTAHDYLGGYGLGAKILFSRQKAGVDALGPENILGFVTGPFTGTQACGGTRYSVVTKSPLTGTWGDANSGGNFGPYLKFAGYDAVFFTGQAAKPVYLLIDEGKIELKDAVKLWGKDSYETEDLLKAEYGKEAEIACVGLAGEKLSLISGIVNNKGRIAARSGVGAVMGSKKLKAIVVKGNKAVPVADAAKIAELRKVHMNNLGPLSGLLKPLGTIGFTEGNNANGDAPIKNFAGAGSVDFKQVANIGGNAFLDLENKKWACYHCSIACGGSMREGTGQYKYVANVHKPEYETVGMLGTNCLNDNPYSIIKLNDICNRYGLDTISVGGCVAFAIECYENKIISKKETDGIEMTWGNHQSIVAMTEKIARREGFGDILADGVMRAAQKIGKGSEKYAMHIGGQEYPAHDPRFAYSKVCGYRMDATPGKHNRDGANNPPGVPGPKPDPSAWSGMGDVQRYQMSYRHIPEALGLCLFWSDCFQDASVALAFLNAITGANYSLDDLVKIGERIATIRHAFNLREGINPLKFYNPDRMKGIPPLKEGPLAGRTIDEESIMREYLTAMDWDWKTTKPSRKKLIDLDMADVAAVIEAR